MSLRLKDSMSNISALSLLSDVAFLSPQAFRISAFLLVVGRVPSVVIPSTLSLADRNRAKPVRRAPLAATPCASSTTALDGPVLELLPPRLFILFKLALNPEPSALEVFLCLPCVAIAAVSETSCPEPEPVPEGLLLRPLGLTATLPSLPLVLLPAAMPAMPAALLRLDPAEWAE